MLQVERRCGRNPMSFAFFIFIFHFHGLLRTSSDRCTQDACSMTLCKHKCEDQHPRVYTQ